MTSSVSTARRSHPPAEALGSQRNLSGVTIETRGHPENSKVRPILLAVSDRVDSLTGGAFSFGPFRVLPMQRRLLHGDETVLIGSRALDILIALVERAGELVAKDELMGRVWPNTFVEPANLTVHIASLRRALGDGRDGNRFVVNIPGRGYQFVEPVTLVGDL